VNGLFLPLLLRSSLIFLLSSLIFLFAPQHHEPSFSSPLPSVERWQVNVSTPAYSFFLHPPERSPKRLAKADVSHCVPTSPGGAVSLLAQVVLCPLKTKPRQKAGFCCAYSHTLSLKGYQPARSCTITSPYMSGRTIFLA